MQLLQPVNNMNMNGQPLQYAEVLNRIQARTNLAVEDPVLYNNEFFNSPIYIEPDDEVYEHDLYIEFMSNDCLYMVNVQDYFQVDDMLAVD